MYKSREILMIAKNYVPIHRQPPLTMLDVHKLNANTYSQEETYQILWW